MANRKVSLLRQCKLDNGTWRRYPAVIGKNGRVKPGYVIAGGEEKYYETGYYQLRSYQGSKTVIKTLGDFASTAMAALEKETKKLAAKEAADVAGVQILDEAERITLSKELTRYVRVVNDRGSEVAAKVYRLAADEFLGITGRTYADQVTSDDIGQYHAVLRKRGCSARTIHNRHANLISFLRYCGRDISALAPSRPKYEKTMPEIYGDELKPFFGSLKQDYHKLLFEVLLTTGLREQEAMHLEWADISVVGKTLLVCSKTHWGFKVKDKEERSLPIPEDLLARLLAFKKTDNRLVFGTKQGKPNTKMLRTLKRLVHRAGLNCKVCRACRERNECELWFLHKFRATYATKLLRSGLDIKSVQVLLGHADMESTLRYLRAAEGKEMQAAVNSINWI